MATLIAPTHEAMSGLNEYPIELLWRHVIERAVRDALSLDPHETNSIKRWLISEDFDFVCDAAQVAPEALRNEFIKILKAPSRGAARYMARALRRAVLQKRKDPYRDDDEDD